MDLQKQFLIKFTLDDVRNITTIAIDEMLEPMIVFPDYGGTQLQYICLLPKRKWGKWFSNEIRNRRDWPL